MSQSPDQSIENKWSAAACAWGLGVLVYTLAFAAGEALLEMSFRARLPIVVWVAIYIFIGAYHVNLVLGLVVHLLFSVVFGLGAGLWLRERITPPIRGSV
jgi:hypothetical protein